jgi:hypothetical protein
MVSHGWRREHRGELPAEIHRRARATVAHREIVGGTEARICTIDASCPRKYIGALARSLRTERLWPEVEHRAARGNTSGRSRTERLSAGRKLEFAPSTRAARGNTSGRSRDRCAPSEYIGALARSLRTEIVGGTEARIGAIDASRPQKYIGALAQSLRTERLSWAAVSVRWPDGGNIGALARSLRTERLSAGRKLELAPSTRAARGNTSVRSRDRCAPSKYIGALARSLRTERLSAGRKLELAPSTRAARRNTSVRSRNRCAPRDCRGPRSASGGPTVGTSGRSRDRCAPRDCRRDGSSNWRHRREPPAEIHRGARAIVAHREIVVGRGQRPVARRWEHRGARRLSAAVSVPWPGGNIEGAARGNSSRDRCAPRDCRRNGSSSWQHRGERHTHA